AGAAANGLRPVVAIYSTFIQRAYDQIWDVALQKLNVTFALDRAGVVPEDGPTHQGIFDLAFMSIFPNIIVMAPSDGIELRNMLYTAVYTDLPASIRYPKGNVPQHKEECDKLQEIEIGKGELLLDGHDGAIIAIGSMVEPSLKAAEILRQKGYSVAVVNGRFRKPLDCELVKSVGRNVPVVSVEEGILEGGFGWAVQVALGKKIAMMGIPDEFPKLGTRNELLEQYNLTPEGIAKTFLENI
ncbi:MAG: transketolase C-terminal domain-containing protein, partial [Candidatus Korarchaeota archaeon]